MKRGKKPSGIVSQAYGYTIVEVMLFLVITATLFVSAVAIFQGKQARTEFSQGIREIDSHIQEIINETASGFYPHSQDFRCTASGGGPNITGVTGTEQGANTDCIFLGKAIQFGPAGANCDGSTVEGCDSYKLYTVVGQRQTGSGPTAKEVTSLQQAVPTVIPGLTQDFKFPGGFHLTRTRVVTASGTSNESTIGFMSSLAIYNTSSSDLVSGAQKIDIVPVSGVPLGSDPATAMGNVGSMNESARSPQKVILCFEGYAKRVAAITIGGSGRQLTTDVAYDENVPGECTS